MKPLLTAESKQQSDGRHGVFLSSGAVYYFNSKDAADEAVRKINDGLPFAQALLLALTKEQRFREGQQHAAQ